MLVASGLTMLLYNNKQDRENKINNIMSLCHHNTSYTIRTVLLDLLFLHSVKSTAIHDPPVEQVRLTLWPGLNLQGR